MQIKQQNDMYIPCHFFHMGVLKGHWEPSRVITSGKGLGEKVTGTVAIETQINRSSLIIKAWQSDCNS